MAARCEAKPLPKRQERKPAIKTAPGRPGSAPPAVARADGRWPMAAADGRWARSVLIAAGTRTGEPAAEAAGRRAALLPEIVVFSVDETLWEGEIWLSSSGPPYTPSAALGEGAQHERLGAIIDSGGNVFSLRQDALRILREVSTVWPLRRGVSRLCFVASTAAAEWTAAALRAMKIRAAGAGSTEHRHDDNETQREAQREAHREAHRETGRGGGGRRSVGRGSGASMADIAGGY